MIDKVQKLKEWAESSMENAKQQGDKFLHNPYIQANTEGVVWAFSKTVEMLTLLLDSENEKSSQSSQGHGSNSSNAM